MSCIKQLNACLLVLRQGPPCPSRKAAGWQWLEKYLQLGVRQGAPGSAASPGAELQPECTQVAGSQARGKRSMCAGRADPR